MVEIQSNIFFFNLYFSDFFGGKYYVADAYSLWSVFRNSVRHEGSRDRTQGMSQYHRHMGFLHRRGDPYVGEKETDESAVAGLYRDVVWRRMGIENVWRGYRKVPAGQDGLLYNNIIHSILHSVSCDGCCLCLCYSDIMDVKSTRWKDD